jgi:hypothetical protein
MQKQRTYQGLSIAQKKVIKKTIKDDDIVRKKLRQKSARSRPPGLSRSIVLDEEESGEDVGAEVVQSTTSVFLDHGDIEFPIAPFKTISDPIKDLGLSRNGGGPSRRAPMPGSISSVAEESEEGHDVDKEGDSILPVAGHFMEKLTDRL